MGTLTYLALACSVIALLLGIFAVWSSWPGRRHHLDKTADQWTDEELARFEARNEPPLGINKMPAMVSSAPEQNSLQGPSVRRYIDRQNTNWTEWQ